MSKFESFLSSVQSPSKMSCLMSQTLEGIWCTVERDRLLASSQMIVIHMMISENVKNHQSIERYGSYSVNIDGLKANSVYERGRAQF